MNNPSTYLSETIKELKKHWPENRTINIVCHGHSVPSGYFATPYVDTFNAYPHLFHKALKERFPYAVINVIVTGIGGENSESGDKRLEETVLNHKPDIITIDYGLNDRGIGLETSKKAWSSMIEKCLESDSKVLLMTPTLDQTMNPSNNTNNDPELTQHAEQIIKLANQYNIGLVDSFNASLNYIKDNHISDILSASNHPNALGHQLVTKELMRWFTP
jgi:acyl-CoA thioesterase I